MLLRRPLRNCTCVSLRRAWHRRTLRWSCAEGMARTLLAQWLNSLIQITDDDLLLAWTTPQEKMALRITVEELEQEFQA